MPMPRQPRGSSGGDRQDRTLPKHATLADAGSGTGLPCTRAAPHLPPLSPGPETRMEGDTGRRARQGGEAGAQGRTPVRGRPRVTRAVPAPPPRPGAPRLSRRADTPRRFGSCSLNRTPEWKCKRNSYLIGVRYFAYWLGTDSRISSTPFFHALRLNYGDRLGAEGWSPSPFRVPELHD